jgi:hypothetical protein
MPARTGCRIGCTSQSFDDSGTQQALGRSCLQPDTTERLVPHPSQAGTSSGSRLKAHRRHSHNTTSTTPSAQRLHMFSLALVWCPVTWHSAVHKLPCHHVCCVNSEHHLSNRTWCCMQPCICPSNKYACTRVSSSCI